MSDDTTKKIDQSEQDAYAAAYLDAKRFPLTSQEGLTLQKQRMLDMANKNGLRAQIESGTPLTPDQEAIAKELEEKDKLLAERTENAG